MQKRGNITLVTGPMFSGKSSELVRRINRCKHPGTRCALIRPLCDTRPFLTHDGHMAGVTFCVNIGDIMEKPEIKDAAVVFIDEGQFFPDLLQGVLDLVTRGSDVVVTALNGDSRQCPFPQIADLGSHCNEILLLLAVCRCGENAPYSIRLDQSIVATVDIGGSEKYDAVCRGCLTKTNPRMAIE